MPFGADDIRMVFALTEGGSNIVIDEINLQVGEWDSQIVNGNEEFCPRLAKHNVRFVIQFDELVERS